MSEAELSTTQHSGALETDAAVLTAEQAQPAASDQENGGTPPPEEPPVTVASSPDGPVEEEEKRAISPRKLAANRANAQRSTGPQTADGKAKSAQNAIKHGIFAKRFLHAASPEAGAEMETLIRDLRDHYQPVGKVEEMLVEKVAIEYARYARVLGAEQQVLARQHAFFYVTVDRFARYATSTNRALSRAIEELERVQAARRARASAAAGTREDEKQPASEVVDAGAGKSA